MSLNIKPLKNIGIEILDFDISQPFTDEVKEQLRALWYEYGVLVFRNQDMNPERQIEFSRILAHWNCTRSRPPLQISIQSYSNWRMVATKISI